MEGACIEHSNVTKMCELCRDKDKATITNSDEIEAINESLIPQQMFSKSTTNVTLISESGLYRILAKRDGEPWFVAKDVCTCLELENVSQACARLDEDDWMRTKFPTSLAPAT